MNIKKEDPWLAWAIELQALSQSGLAYTENIYEKERYERIREISAEMLSFKTDLPVEKVKELFCNETGYQTPKVSTRAIVIKNKKILLVKEKSGKWALPGGWCDVLETVASNTIKEVREEAGMKVSANRILMVQDRNKHNKPFSPYGHIIFFVDCTYISGIFTPNSETVAAEFFSIDELPPLDERKTSEYQIHACLSVHNDPSAKTVFD